MGGEEGSRSLRGAVGNAAVWGMAWFAMWLVYVVASFVLGVVGILPGISWLQALGGAVRFGIPFGILGFVTGGAFSGLVRLLYRGRRLSDMGWVRLGIGGGVLAGALVPVFLQAMNVLTGGPPVPWELLLDDGLFTAAFGGIAAGGSIKLAQVAEKRLPPGDADRVHELDGPGRLAPEREPGAG